MDNKVNLSEFLPEISLTVGDIPETIAEHYVLQSAIEFCERSQILQRTLQVDLQGGVQDYELEVDEGERIVSVHQICVQDRCFSSEALMRNGRPCDTGCTVYGHAVWFVPPSTLNVNPIPQRDRQDAMRVDVAVAPQRDVCELDTLLYDRYQDVITHGALARLFLAKATPWHDKTLAQYHLQLFNAGIASAGVDRMTGFMRGRIDFKPRRII